MNGQVKPAEATDEEWDAARRMADAVNLHVAVQNAQMGNGRERPGYVAIRLSDGRSPDGKLYDTRKDAARHQADPWNFYVRVGRESMSPREAWIVLNHSRAAKRRGVVFSEEEVITPQRLELVRGVIPRTFRGATRG